MIDNLTYLFINWKNKLYESDTDWNFNISINLPPNIFNTFTHISLIEISIPKSFYNIEDFKFDLYENDVKIVIWLPNGSYKNTQLFNYLWSVMSLNSLNNIKYVVWMEITNGTYDTGHLKIIWDDNTLTKYIQLPYDNYTFGVLGFNENLIAKHYFENNTILIWQNIINLNQQWAIFLHCSVVNNFYSDPNINSQSILASVFFSQNIDLSYIVKNFDLIYNMKPFKYVSSIFKFWLTNVNGELINLNGVDLNFVITLFRYTPNYIFYKKIWQFINFNLIKDEE